MRPTTAGMTGRRAPRSRLIDPAGSFRRGELAAGLATAAIVGQLLFAPVMLLAAVALVATGRLSRWRPQWLAVPALASVISLLAVGVPAAVAGAVQSARRLADYVLGAAAHPSRFAHPAVAVAGAGAWLPRQLSLAGLAACAEAALVLWLGWWRHPERWRWRPGLLAMVRRRTLTRALASGHTVTSDGCALGLEVGTGKPVKISWAAAAHGVLLTGQDADQLGLAVVSAALRRRKTVLVVDCVSRPDMNFRTVPADAVGRVGALARSLAVPVAGADAGAAAGGGVGVAAAGREGATAGDAVGAVTAGRHWAAMARREGAPSVGGVSLTSAIGRAIRGRETLLITAKRADEARAAVRCLCDVLDGLRALGLQADCLAWISGCDLADSAFLSELLAVGPLTGTATVLSTASHAYGAALAAATGVVVITGPLPAAVALDLSAGLQVGHYGPAPIGRDIRYDARLRAAMPTSRPYESAAADGADGVKTAIHDILHRQHGGEFTMLASTPPDGGPGRVTTGCRVVPITLGYTS